MDITAAILGNIEGLPMEGRNKWELMAWASKG
jgi:hypothetical protein